MKKLLNVVLLSAVAVIIAGMALEQCHKAYAFFMYGEHTQTWYVPSADVTCIQTMNPYARVMTCLHGDLSSEDAE